MADKATRDGGAARCAAPAGPQRIAGALALLTSDDALRGDIARPLVNTAPHPAATTRSRRHTVPGIGTRLRLVRLDDIHDMHRLPRVQDVVSSGRLGPWAQAAARQRLGTSGPKSGKAQRPWACAAAAVL